jgi:hypothetical protein
MIEDPRERPDKPRDPPYGGGEDEHPNGDRVPGGDVKEPPPAGVGRKQQKFPRKDEP